MGCIYCRVHAHKATSELEMICGMKFQYWPELFVCYDYDAQYILHCVCSQSRLIDKIHLWYVIHILSGAIYIIRLGSFDVEYIL